MVSNRQIRRIEKQKSKLEKKRFGKVNDFRDMIRERCFIDNEDNLIVEVIKDVGEWDWKYDRTVKIPVNSISTFHDIYIQSDTMWNEYESPTIYVDYEVENFNVVDQKLEGIDFNDDQGVSNRYVEDNLFSYPLNSKLIRPWLSKNFGLRSGYDRQYKWTHTLTDLYYTHIVKPTTEISTIRRIVPLGLSGIDVPLGKCII